MNQNSADAISEKYPLVILGAGITGLAAGFASGATIYEAAEIPGGICSSYYICKGNSTRLYNSPADGNSYRFEIGGGHWIFGNSSHIYSLLERTASFKEYKRLSSVYFNESEKYIPYPIQNHLGGLDKGVAANALSEMVGSSGKIETMKDWLCECFGQTLCKLFFYPFHELYTAGLYHTIAPQDTYKSPVNLNEAINGAMSKSNPVGYNTTFVYPQEGLNVFVQELASFLDVRYGKHVVKIDYKKKRVYFKDGSKIEYDRLVSTLPLNKVLTMAQFEMSQKTDPYTSVLVLNISAKKGRKCPDDHWLYVPDAKSGFHRVGFYSNVDPSFLPKEAQKNGDEVSIYVERAYSGGIKPSDEEIKRYISNVTEELQDWHFIGDTEVVDPTWIDVAYTWSWPGSTWKHEAIQTLEKYDIYSIGRYGRWKFQGITDSIGEGLLAGAALRAF